MFTLNIRGELHTYTRPVVMGILNTTPDSFFSGSRFSDTKTILEKVGEMIREGMEILDVGGQSTRPGAISVVPGEEMARVIPVIQSLHAQFPDLVMSIDTSSAEVAEAAIRAGAGIVNDISGGLTDDKMLETVAKHNSPYICMHMRGTSATMHTFTDYEDMLPDILRYFAERIKACREAGIKDIILDPGFGFAKNAAQNFKILHELNYFREIGCPILAGLSRKKTIYQTLDTTAEHALNGTTVLNTVALQNGAAILRVHDVQQAFEAIQLMEAYKAANSN